jgi:tRNA-(ms[2]io[6]A)-hydroxylase
MNDADVKNILGLKLPTDPRWVNLAEKSMEEILTDHAFCEQKAATTCISLAISGRCWQNYISVG